MPCKDGQPSQHAPQPHTRAHSTAGVRFKRLTRKQPASKGILSTALDDGLNPIGLMYF